MTASVALPSLLTTSAGRSPKCPAPSGPFMFTGILWIKMPACGFCGAGFAIFGGWLAASFGMNMEAMFTGR